MTDLYPAASVSTSFSLMLTKIVSTFSNSIGILLLVLGALIALGFLVALAKRHIGQPIGNESEFTNSMIVLNKLELMDDEDAIRKGRLRGSSDVHNINPV